IDHNETYARPMDGQLIQQVAGEIEIGFKQVTKLSDKAIDLRTAFEIAVDVIHSLLNDRVLGVVLLYGWGKMDELAFYLTLFTRKYKKPIIFCEFPNNLSLGKTLEHRAANQVKKKQFRKHSKLSDLLQAIKIAANPTNGLITPLKVYQQNISFATPHLESYFVGANRLNNRHSTKKLLNDDIFLSTSGLISQLIGHMPVIPEKVALIRLTLGMEGEEILSIIKHYA